uniref:FeMo cofactor biosynthesis protein NifB n=1 Tax=Magnetococcus massalia (strain MO-1) TaxID=451514 RepID=A0A1S7LCL2_MAGMO|nr:Nitrogenase FeMo cofactor biosynthesis protein NifB [Candidatus Magnetococcus massalia]
MSASCASSSGGPSVDTHPCFSKDAHHKYARMHLAVAPACNIQCNYCNRKYDCTNESRPGVVSELLTPDEALIKVRAVKEQIPQLTVVGIAGPGDPLANPERTFEVCEKVAKEFPDIQLCLSTNGLTLPDHVERIKQLGVHHVTITINALDATVASQIYPWIYHGNRRKRGEKAAAILIENQFKGLNALVEQGVLVKVNSVMIPGVNDRHLLDVNREVSERGAFLHNIMPLISAPEHGTYFGLTGQRNPEDGELEALRGECTGDVEQMTHCRQCRADAVGMLGEDRNDDFTMDKIAASAEPKFPAFAGQSVIPIQVNAPANEEPATQAAEEVVDPGPERLIAVTSEDGKTINQHFGHAERFLVYRATATDVTLLEQRDASRYCHGDLQCGEKESALDLALKTLTDCEAIICERIGFMPWQSLEEQGIQPINRFAGESIEAALKKYCLEKRDESAAASVARVS